VGTPEHARLLSGRPSIDVMPGLKDPGIFF
jgi:hypothetical protein